MDYQSLHAKTVVELRRIAKEMGVRVPAGTNKRELIERLLEADQAAQTAPQTQAAPREKVSLLTEADKANAGEPGAARAEAEASPAEPPKRRRGRPRKQPLEPPEPQSPAAPREQAPAAPKEQAPAPLSEEAPRPAAAPRPMARRPLSREAEQGQPGPGDAIRPRVQPRALADAPWTRGVRPARMTGDGNPTPREKVSPRAEAAPREKVSPRAEAAPRERVSPRAEAASWEKTSPQPSAEPVHRAVNPAVPELLATGECMEGAGVLEIQPDGYGFLRAENCLPGPKDVYISIAQIRRFNLRMGDYVEGKTRPQREGDRYSAMLYITSVNGEDPERTAGRPRFEDLVPVYPDERLRLEPGAQTRGDLSLRIIDMLAPIGKGQRGMIVSQPKAGKTTLLKKVANAITDQYPDIHLIVLLIDERPEEVTDMKRSIDGEVVYSTFDESPENHTRVSEMVLERAQRLVEMGKDVVVLMDSITRLARAYNLVIAPTGRSLSGGLDPGALFRPKRFFGAARNIENGGSLTVIATALVETGSRMDDIIYEEFKGTGNMELHLDRRLSDKRVFPAIDMARSGTRREELLLSEEELEGELQVRRMLSGGRPQETAEQLIDLMTKTATNADFFHRLKGWLSVYEKEGYTLGGR